MAESKSLPIRITLHDNHQIEMLTVYPISPTQSKGRETKFFQDIYFFLPQTMGINRDTYPKDQFYRSLTNFIRLKTPRLLNDQDRHDLKLESLIPLLMGLQSDEKTTPKADDLIQEARLFGMVLNDQLKNAEQQGNAIETFRFVEELKQLIEKFRRVIDQVELDSRYAGQTALVASLGYIDEYLSVRFEETLIELAKKTPHLLHLMADEFQRRKTKQYLQMTENSSEIEGEAFLHRKARFKKFISEIFYMNVVRYKREQFFANLAAAIGAILAAVITSLIDPHSRESLSRSYFSDFWNSVPLVIAVAAIFYATKDRLKDRAKIKLMQWFKAWIPDYNFKIKTHAGKVLGHCQETVNFMRPNRVAKEIVEARLLGHGLMLPTDAVEDVIHYSRRTVLTDEVILNQGRAHDSIKDILLFDVSHLLTKLSNPEQNEHFVTDEFGIFEKKLRRVYHVRLLVRLRVGPDLKNISSDNIYQVRLVIDKRGLKRIETVDSESQVRANHPKQFVREDVA